MSHERDTKNCKKVVVTEHGPYVVHGCLPLVRKTQVVSEHGEPLTWLTGSAFDTPGTYDLCRGTKAGHAKALPLIREVLLPATDPVFGPDGPLVALWRA